MLCAELLSGKEDTIFGCVFSPLISPLYPSRKLEVAMIVSGNAKRGTRGHLP